LENYIEDGTPCTLNIGNSTTEGECATGECTSRDIQCKSSFIESNGDCLKTSDQCTVSCDINSKCETLRYFYRDGTRCSWSGKCYKGECHVTIYGVIMWNLVSNPTAKFFTICVVVEIILAFTYYYWKKRKDGSLIYIPALNASDDSSLNSTNSSKPDLLDSSKLPSIKPKAKLKKLRLNTDVARKDTLGTSEAISSGIAQTPFRRRASRGETPLLRPIAGSASIDSPKDGPRNDFKYQ
jgi:hypothetical protein